jgi:hypothetical protein
MVIVWSGKLLVVFASTVILGFESLLSHDSGSCAVLRGMAINVTFSILFPTADPSENTHRQCEVYFVLLPRHTVATSVKSM